MLAAVKVFVLAASRKAVEASDGLLQFAVIDPELALALFYTGRAREAAELWRKLLDSPALPAAQRPRIEKNLSFAQP